MTSFLAQIGKNIADRWLALLMIPGLLWIAAALGAYHLGQAHPLDPGPFMSWLKHLATPPAANRNAAIAIAASAILLASAVPGLAAGGLGRVLQHLWGARGTRPPLIWVLHARQRRWTTIREKARGAVGRANSSKLSGKALVRYQSAAQRSYHRMRARPTAPQRPTWIADCFHATTERAEDLYGVNLDLVWPRLWSVLPDTLRTDITAAGDGYASAARLGGWALLYSALVVFWWPAGVLGAIIAGFSIAKARAAASMLAALIDTAVDLHLTDLMDKLGANPPSPDAGQALKRRLGHPGT